MVFGNRVRIENIPVLRPPGFAGFRLDGDDGVLINAEFQGSGSDGPVEETTDTAPIGVLLRGERNEVKDVVVSAFPLAIGVSFRPPPLDPIWGWQCRGEYTGNRLYPGNLY